MKYSEALRKDPKSYAKMVQDSYKNVFAMEEWEKKHNTTNRYSSVNYKDYGRCFVRSAVYGAFNTYHLTPEEIATQLEACGE